MRHAKSFRKFSRTAAHRRAMFRNMTTSMIEHERLETTVEKAKDLRGVVEKLVTLAGEDTLPHRRRAYGYLKNKAVVHKLFADIGPRFRSRPGGYTRVIRTRRRAGDAAELAIIEFVDRSEPLAPKPSRAKKKQQKAAAAEGVEEESAAES